MTDMVEKIARAMWEANTPYSDSCSWDFGKGRTHMVKESKDTWRGFARAALEAMREPTEEMMDNVKLKVGDKIRLEYQYGETRDHVIEEFRQCLGIFHSPQAREAGSFTPICELYGPGPDTEEKYVSNYGTYRTNQVPVWMNLPSVNKSPEIPQMQGTADALEKLTIKEQKSK